VQTSVDVIEGHGVRRQQVLFIMSCVYGLVRRALNLLLARGVNRHPKTSLRTGAGMIAVR
jgi:hypothetical protein